MNIKRSGFHPAAHTAMWTQHHRSCPPENPERAALVFPIDKTTLTLHGPSGGNGLRRPAQEYAQLNSDINNDMRHGA